MPQNDMRDIDKQIAGIVYGVAAWRQLPYHPDAVKIEDVVTPAEAKHRIKQLLVAARIDELQRTRKYDDMDENDEHIEIEHCIINRIAELQQELEH